MIVFTIPVPPSLKNGMKLSRGRGGIRMRRSAKVLRSQAEVRSAAFAAMAAKGVSEPAFGGDDIGVNITHDVRTDSVTVRVWSMGPRQKGRTGRKRDLQNLQDGILDALQGIAFVNDNQVSNLTMIRRTS